MVKYKEDFEVKTPNGESQGWEYICFDPEFVFPGTDNIKMYLFKFSKYDILLGHETLNKLTANINFKNKKLECADGNKQLLFLISNKNKSKNEIKLKQALI